MTPFFHPHPSPLPSREREIVLPGKYGRRELERGRGILQDKGFEFRISRQGMGLLRH
jgi:hypothetical protein